MSPDLDRLAAQVNENSIRLIMIVGKFDKVILAKNMHLLLDNIDSKQFHVVDTGHNDLINKSLLFLSQGQ